MNKKFLSALIKIHPGGITQIFFETLDRKIIKISGRTYQEASNKVRENYPQLYYN